MSRLTMFFLGPPRIELDGAPIEVDTRKAIALLAYLAVTGRSHSRDLLVNLLWPDYDQTRARSALRHTLYVLKVALSGGWLDANRETIGLNRDEEFWLDMDEFHKHLSECRIHGHPSTETCPDCLSPLTEAVEFYQGDFMAGFSLHDSSNFDDWQSLQAQSLSRELSDALDRLVRCHSTQGEFEKAIGYARRWLSLDPLHEEAHRSLMELYVWSGRRSDALRQYEECVRVLKEDIGTSPQEKTTELYEAIKENRMPVAEFHPRKSADARRNNLPRQLTSFIGREREIAEVKRLLSTIYLLTLTGSGGCGKTRLALQVAADLVEEYSNGVWLVELASLSDPSLVPQAVARALDVSEQPGRPLTETLSDFLRPKSLLLMLDNCEHLIEACARLSEDLLHACPNLKILATSREALGIAGETPWRVPSLSLPDPQRLKSIEASVLTQYEAVRLFIDRAATVLPSFTVTNKNASVVAQICCRLDGIPLAIELGAARVKVLSVEQIADRLDDRFRLLTGGSRTAIPRHQTLLATIDWSYDLLSEAERALLRRLSVFAGGWTLPAAEAVCVGEGIEGHEILDLLTRLVDKSMVMVVEHSGEARYRLLETIRQYGRDKLLEAGEESVLGKKHLEWFLALTEEAEPKLNGPDQVLWLERLEPEHDNLRAALGWSLRSGEGEHGLRLARALERFWRTRGYISEVWRWHEETLSKSEGASASLRAKVLRIAGDVAVAQGNIEQAVKTLEESLALSRVTGDKRDIAYALLSRGHMGLVVLNQDDYGQVVALLEEGLALFQGLQDKRGIAESLRLLGEMALRQGDYSRANALLEESLALFQELGDKLSIAISLHMLGDTATRQGDYNRAKTLLEDSLSMFREIRSKLSTGQSLHRLGLAVLRQGDYDRAEALFEEGLTMFYEAGMKSGIAECLEGLAELAGATGQLERAGQLSGAAEALREAIRHPIQPSDRPPYDRSVAAVRARLGEEAFAKVWEEGRKMKLEEAIEWAGGSEHDRKFC